MKKVALIVGIIALFTLGGYRIIQHQKRGEKKDDGTTEQGIAVKAVPAIQGDVPEEVSITGVIKAKNEVAVVPKIPGRITRLFVNVGEKVKAGQTLATIESTDYALRMQQAQAQVEATQAQLAQAQQQQTQAASNYSRAQNLKDKGVMAQSDYEQIETATKMAMTGKDAVAAQIKLAEANLALARESFSNTKITTPIAGVVTRKSVDVGAMATGVQPVFVVQDQTSYIMTGTVPSSFVTRIKPGLQVNVEIEELQGQVVTGVISFISPSLDAETRRAAVEIAIRPQGQLLPNMFGTAKINLGTRSGVITIPQTAVINAAGTIYVYVVKDDKVQQIKPVLGEKMGDTIIIEKGINAKDLVVVSGDTGLKEGQAIRLQP
jgi:HlyD family secretion protein